MRRRGKRFVTQLFANMSDYTSTTGVNTRDVAHTFACPFGAIHQSNTFIAGIDGVAVRRTILSSTYAMQAKVLSLLAINVLPRSQLEHITRDNDQTH